jgi:flagellar FliJ protein
MRRFHFRLERLLEIRAFREREWLGKLAEASGHCVRLFRRITENSTATREAFHTQVTAGEHLDLHLLSYREHYLKRLGGEKIKLQKALEDRLRRRAEVQKKYQEVSRDKKVLERLKEKRQEEYYARARLDEFKNLDDLNSSQFIRKR